VSNNLLRIRKSRQGRRRYLRFCGDVLRQRECRIQREASYGIEVLRSVLGHFEVGQPNPVRVWDSDSEKYFEGIFERGEDLDSPSRVTLKMMANGQSSPVLSDLRS